MAPNILFVTDSRGRGLDVYLNNIRPPVPFTFKFVLRPGAKLSELRSIIEDEHSSDTYYDVTFVLGGINDITTRREYYSRNHRGERHKEVIHANTSWDQLVSRVSAFNHLSNVKLCTIAPALLIDLQKHYIRQNKLNFTRYTEEETKEQQKLLEKDVHFLNRIINNYNHERGFRGGHLEKLFLKEKFKNGVKIRSYFVYGKKNQHGDYITKYLYDGIHADTGP